MIRRMLVWVSRLHRCRGFGVQSPWAYGFIRYVLNEHYPYYGYTTLREVVTGISGDMRRLCELYLRIANHCRARNILDFGRSHPAYESYFRAGSRRSEILKVGDGDSQESYAKLLAALPAVEMARISPTGNFRLFYSLARSRVTDGSLFIIEGIHDKSARGFWRDIVRSEPRAVTFDLYYCGIVIFDAKRYKQNYIVNF